MDRLNEIRFTIFGAPASKANSRMLVRFGDRPASIKSPKARAYEATAWPQIPKECLLNLECDVRVTIKIFYASRRPDLDESVCLDVLQARRRTVGKRRLISRDGVYLNDRQVKEKHISWGLDKANPRAEIVVERMEDKHG